MGCECDNLIADQIRCKAATELRKGIVSFQSKLKATEVLTGTPVISDNQNLSITSVGVNTTQVVEGSTTVDVGKGVQFSVAGGTAGTRYMMKVAASTNAGQVMVGFFRLDVAEG